MISCMGFLSTLRTKWRGHNEKLKEKAYYANRHTDEDLGDHEDEMNAMLPSELGASGGAAILPGVQGAIEP